MRRIKHLLLAVMAPLLLIVSTAQAEPLTNSVVGVQGYDLVSYHTSERPNRGNGNHVVNYENVNYLFTNEVNKKAFEANPQKYLPTYGGYCAFGVSVNKKFIADPEIWEIVDGKLYFNLDNSIKGIWVKDITGNIKKADANWKKIKDKNPQDL